MIKVTVLYPNAPDARFDMTYYVSHHLPMVREKCGPECRSIAAEGGIAGGAPDSQAPYIAIGHLTFESLATFQKVFTPHSAEIFADIPNYTNIKPVVQISEIAL